MTLSYSNVCPAPQEFSLQNLVFWSMGYGGWMGVGIMPLIWSSTNNNVIRFILSFFSPAICSFAMTAFFLAFYMISMFIRSMGEIMTNPTFLVSSMGSVVISLTSLALYVALVRKKLIDSNEKDTEGSEAEGSEGESSEVESSEGESSEDEGEGSEASESESSEGESSDAEGTVPNTESTYTWREKANFAGLREAPELPA